MKRPSGSVELAAFLASAVVLGLFYGYAARALGWFPDALLDRAGGQLRTQLSRIPLFSDPPFVWPRVYDRSGARVFDRSAMESGLTLLETHARGPSGWRPALELIDADGEVLHRWRVDPRRLFPTSRRPDESLKHQHVHGSYLFPDGDVLLTIEYVGTARLGPCGDVRWRLSGTHHSISRADDGTFWVARRKESRNADSVEAGAFPGLPENVYDSRLTRVSADGEVRRELSVLRLLYSNDMEQHIFQRRSTSESGREVLHLNDVERLDGEMADAFPEFDAGDLVVSLRDTHLVLVVDPASERIKWARSGPWIRQHDPDFLAEGWIGVFDNNVNGSGRGSILGGSRIVAVQPHTDSTEVWLEGRDLGSFYTRVGGKWQRLDNGNLLLTEALAGRVLEVAPDGELVWEWVSPPYSRSKVPGVWNGTRYDLTRENAESWPCSPTSQ